MMNKELYLMRHGTTVMSGLYVGSTDVPLADEGRKQVVQAGMILTGVGINHIFCSPMKRCRESLNLLGLDASSEIDENLREIDFGRWEGRSFEEISQADASLVEEWRIKSDYFCFPEGECVEEFSKRVGLFAKKVIDAPIDRILILAHGGTIGHLLCILLGLSQDKRIIFDIQAGGVSSVTLYGDIGALTSLNLKG